MTTKQAPAAPSDAATPSKTAAATPDLGSARVLLADSDAGQRAHVSATLAGRGYDTVGVTECAEAIPSLEANAIDVVVVAAGLAGGGAAAIAAIREQRRYADVPIIVIAASDDALPPPRAATTS